MTWACLLLALAGLDVGRSRTTTVPRSIERTLVRIGVGLAESAGSEQDLAKLCTTLEGDDATITIRDPRLYVDGQREGCPAGRILRGLATVGLFVLDRSNPGDSVELTYTVAYRGLTIHRSVTISDGQIVSRASFPCTLGPQGRVKAVWLQYVARETAAGTTITTTTTVRCNTGICPDRSTSRLRVVNRLAGRSIAGQLDGMLLAAEREGRRLSDTGHAAIVGHVQRLTTRLLRWTR